MNAITITRQIGVPAEAVASQIAVRLESRILGQEVINTAARRAGNPEMALSLIDDLGLLGLRASPRNRTEFNRVLKEVVEERIREGKVIFTCPAGCVLLREREDILHVRMTAPLKCRIQVLVEEMKISPAAAHNRIVASDDSRKRFMRDYYDIDWNDPQLYDLVLNLGKLSVKTASELICQAYSRETAPSQNKRNDRKD